MLTVAILLLGGLSPGYQSSKMVSIKTNKQQQQEETLLFMRCRFFVYELQ